METSPDINLSTKSLSVAKNFFTSVKGLKDISLIQQVTSVSVWAWLISLLIFTPFVLYNYLSPVVMKMALEPVVAPIAGLFMVLLGEFDLSKLSTAMSSNAGLILKIGGTLTVALFAQNCLKSALFLQSLKPWHKEHCVYSLAGIFTPISTVAVMYVLFSFGFLLKLQTVILAFLGIFIAEGAAEAVKAASQSMQLKNSINLNDLQTILGFVSSGIRLGLGMLLTAWVVLICFLYVNIHKVLHYVFDIIISNFDLAKVKNILVPVKDKIKKYFKIFCEFYVEKIGGFGTFVGLILSAVSCFFLFSDPIFNKLTSLSCTKSTIQGIYENKFVVLADLKNKKGICYDSEDIKKLRVGDSFAFEGKVYYQVILKDSHYADAKDKYGRTYTRAYDLLLDKKEIVWMIEPKTFKEKGLQMGDFPDFSKVEKAPKIELEKLENNKESDKR